MPYCTHTIIIIVKMIQTERHTEPFLQIQVFTYVIVLFQFIY